MSGILTKPHLNFTAPYFSQSRPCDVGAAVQDPGHLVERSEPQVQLIHPNRNTAQFGRWIWNWTNPSTAQWVLPKYRSKNRRHSWKSNQILCKQQSLLYLMAANLPFRATWSRSFERCCIKFFKYIVMPFCLWLVSAIALTQLKIDSALKTRATMEKWRLIQGHVEFSVQFSQWNRLMGSSK